MIKTPPGARSIGPRFVSIPVILLDPDAVGTLRSDST
jgi:hypothetical protein